MNITRKAIAALIVILVVIPLAATTLFLIAINGWVLDRNFYKSLVSDTRLYELWQAETLPDYLNLQATTSADALPVGALGNALREVVPAGYVRDQALSVVDESFDMLEGRTTSPEVLIDIAPIKAALRGPDGARFAAALAGGLPACAAGAPALAPGASIVNCRASGQSTEQTAALIMAGLPGYLDRLPDRINIANDTAGLPYRYPGLNAALLGSLGMNVSIVFLLLITGALWLLAAFLGAESRRGRLQWLGWTLIVPAALVFLIGPAINNGLTNSWLGYGWGSMAGVRYSATLREALFTTAGDALRTIANGFLVTGTVAGLAGLALVFWGAMTPAEGRAPQVLVPAAPLPAAAAPLPAAAAPATGGSGQAGTGPEAPAGEVAQSDDTRSEDA